MTVSTYLTKRAAEAVLSDIERASIRTSIDTIEKRLGWYFQSDAVSEKLTFGSYTRGTILPRSMDSKSDIDYMIVFSNSAFTAQTYLNWLKAFAENYYYASEIKQSFPTVALELNHIRFELVPATSSIFYGYQIPSGDGGWQSTDPNDFNGKLTAANQAASNYLKPAIRLAKYWNALAGFPFESYALEQKIVGMSFWFPSNVRDVFYAIIDNLTLPLWSPKWKDEALARAKRMVSSARLYEQQMRPDWAEAEIARLLP